MKDPYLKPVILGALLIGLLSIIFAPGIFIWAIIGGYITVRIATKATKKIISFFDGILLGLFTGILGGTLLDLVTLFSLKSPGNKERLIRALEKNWPHDIPIPEFKELLPSVFITTCILVIIISIVCGALGGLIGTFISNKKNKQVTL